VKPVDQTTFGSPGGNCLSACIASLLELPIDYVPYFGPPDRVGTGEEWMANIARWLVPRGFYLIVLEYMPDAPVPGLHIQGGMSERGLKHAVIAEGSRIVHDPHPSRAGLTRPEDVQILVPLDPARVAMPGPRGHDCNG
jgi:hypothetical protein